MSMYHNLSDFISALDQAGELVRITDPVSPVLDIAAITDRISKSPCPHKSSAASVRNDPRFHHLGGPALLFENVQGSSIPILINSLGSYRRMEMSLGCERFGSDGFESIAAKIADLVKPNPPNSLRDALRLIRKFLPLLKAPPKRRKGSGPCQEVVIQGDDVDLTQIPMIRCWPLDGDFATLGYPPAINDHIPGIGRGTEWDQHFRGRYITLGGIHTIHADDRDHPKPPSHNIGMYRVQLMGKRIMAMHWHMHHDGARHWRSWKSLGKPMPVAIALGGESVLPYAATAPLPPGMSELLLAGFLNGGGIEMVRAKTVPLWVPANSEIIIEGFVSHDAGNVGWDAHSDGPIGDGAIFEGPFGDHTGFYSLPDRYPILTVTAITQRANPIYPTTIVGLPIQEDYFMGKATERIFLPLLRTIIPDILDYDLPTFGAFHNCAFIKIRKHYPLHARRIMHGIWGAGQMSWTKSIFVVDHDVNVHDTTQVLKAAAKHCEPSRDIERVRGPLDILDHAAPHLGAGTKFGLDCTRKLPGDAAGSPLPLSPITVADHSDNNDLAGRILHAVKAVPRILDARLHADAWLTAKVDSPSEPQTVHRVIDAICATIELLNPPQPPRYLIVLDQNVDLGNIDEALFQWLANSDAARDSRLIRLNNSTNSIWAFDATCKSPGMGPNHEPIRDWPPILKMDPAVDARIDPIVNRLILKPR